MQRQGLSQTRRRLSCQPLHLYSTTIRPAQQGRSDKEKSNPAQKGLFGGYAEAFSEEFFQLLLAFRTFSPFSEDFQVRKQRAFYPIGHGKNEASTRFFLYLNYANINDFKIVF